MIWNAPSNDLITAQFPQVRVIPNKMLIITFNVCFWNMITQTSEVQISGVTYRYVNGTCNSETAIILNCGAGAGCTDIFMDVVNITSASSGSNVLASCNNAHGVAASTPLHLCEID